MDVYHKRREVEKPKSKTEQRKALGIECMVTAAEIQTLAIALDRLGFGSTYVRSVAELLERAGLAL